MRFTVLLLAWIMMGDVASAQGRGVKPTTDIALLGQILNLPATPIRACFIETQLGDNILGPADRILTVVIEFDEAAQKNIVAQLPRIQETRGSLNQYVILMEFCWQALKLPPVDILHGPQQAKIRLTERRDAAAWSRSPYLDGTIFETSQPGLFIAQFQTH